MPINKRGQYKSDDHRDRFFAAIRGGKWRMVRKDDTGLVNDILDNNGLKIGEITFRKKTATRLEFMGGRFYNKAVVSGRLMNSAQALAEFEAIIRSMYVAPDR